MKRVVAAALAVGLVFGLGACGKEIDVQVTKAKQVPGTDDLWYFCHNTTLIYVEKYNGDDSYEAFFAWGCNPDGTMADAFIDPTREGQGNSDNK